MSELRSRLLLSAQRALLGEVFPALRAVTIRWSKDAIALRAYVDGELLDDDAESLSCIATELTADLWQEMRVDYEAIRCDWPQRIDDDDGVFIYARREQT